MLYPINFGEGRLLPFLLIASGSVDQGQKGTYKFIALALTPTPVPIFLSFPNRLILRLVIVQCQCQEKVIIITRKKYHQEDIEDGNGIGMRLCVPLKWVELVDRMGQTNGVFIHQPLDYQTHSSLGVSHSAEVCFRGELNGRLSMAVGGIHSFSGLPFPNTS